MTNFAEIRTFDATTSDTTTYGMAVDASWGGHTKNGYITLHVLKGPDEYPAKGAVSLGWRMLEPLLKVIVERQIGRELMADALRGQRLKVVDDWTDEDEAALVADKKREAEEKVALAEYRKHNEEAQQEHARQEGDRPGDRGRAQGGAEGAQPGDPGSDQRSRRQAGSRRVRVRGVGWPPAEGCRVDDPYKRYGAEPDRGLLRELGLKQRDFRIVCVTLAGKRPGA
ncbi:hypothetical protein [Mesorhizobium sp. M0047]|uniref:hypothetical protein n=1 Tax=Mesorhizobium sp. M0047 TaxID=2956859 RepID=UPI00333739FC